MHDQRVRTFTVSHPKMFEAQPTLQPSVQSYVNHMQIDLLCDPPSVFSKML